jgi:hypothetical protein
MTQEINYTAEKVYEDDSFYDRGNRSIVQAYHSSQRLGFKELHKGAKSSDVANLKKAELANLKKIGIEYVSKFTIGFEIEKNRISSRNAKLLSLIAGYERDGSCGVEAVTNILPLVAGGKWRNKVYSMFADAKRVIEDEYSPSDFKCGGHISIGVEGMSGKEIGEAVRLNCGIIYALFRKRLNNYYTRNNIEMDFERYVGSKYQPVYVKDNVLEFRLPSRVQSVKQMMRRYELMYILLDFSINKPNGSHSSLLKKCEPIVSLMYEGDADKVAEIMTLAKSFHKFLKSGARDENILSYIYLLH